MANSATFSDDNNIKSSEAKITDEKPISDNRPAEVEADVEALRTKWKEETSKHQGRDKIQIYWDKRKETLDKRLA